jgi:hypothetical protein
LRRWGEAANELDEVFVLRAHDDTGSPRTLEDLRILSLAQSEIANVHSVEGEPARDPPAQSRGDLRVEPQNHAATTG